VGSTIVLLTVALFPSPDRPLLLLTATLSVIALSLAPRLHQGYVESLEQSLRAGRVKLDPGKALDRTTRQTITHTNVTLDRESLMRKTESLRDAAGGGSASVDPLLPVIADLRSDRSEAILRHVRQEDLQPELVAHLIPLLAHNDLLHDV